MRRSFVTGLAALVIAVTFAGVLAQSAPSTLYVPYSRLTDLTADQKMKIAAVEADYRARIKALDEEKHVKIHAMLSEAQKATLARNEAEKAAVDKAKRKAAYEKKKAEKAAKDGE